MTDTRPIRLIELCDLELLIKVDSLGNVYTLDKTNIRRNGRVDNRRGRQIRPHYQKAITGSHSLIRENEKLIMYIG